MIKHPIRCILFDLGATLWARQDDGTWDAFLADANQRAITQLSTYVPDLPVATLMTPEHNLSAIINNAIRTAAYDAECEPDFAHATAEALQALGYTGIDDTVGADIFEALRIPIVGSRVIFEDVLPTLYELRRRGFQLGIVTNRYHGGEPFLEDLRTLGFLEYIAPPYIAISGDLGIRKPHPDIFLRVLNAFGISPKEAAMVGDSLYADIYGAQRLGIFTVWKPSPHTRQAAQKASPGTPVGTDTLLAYALAQKCLRQFNTITPDVIIHRTGDLLHLFTKAGPQ